MIRVAAISTSDPPLSVQLPMRTWLRVQPLDIVCGLPIEVVEELPGDADAAVRYYD